MRRIWCFLICLCLLAATGCGGDPQPASGSSQSGDRVEESAVEPDNEEEGDPVPDEAPGIWDPYDFVQLTDDSPPEEKHLMSLVWNSMADRSWENAGQLDPDSLVRFFFSISGPPYHEVDLDSRELEMDEEIVSLLYPASLVDPVIRRHFDVDAEHLHQSMFYLPDEDAYWFGGLGSVSNARILQTDTDGDILVIAYELYRILEYEGSGVLRIRGSGDSYQYLSNEYTFRGLTGAEQELEDRFISVGPDMALEEKVVMALVRSNNAHIPWENPEVNLAADLVKFYSFLAEIGDVVLPEHLERDRYWKYPYVPAGDVEAVVLAAFATTADYLRDCALYDQERGAYRIPPTASGIQCRIVSAQRSGDWLTVGFEAFQNYKPHYEGQVVVELGQGETFRYESCAVEWASP